MCVCVCVGVGGGGEGERKSYPNLVCQFRRLDCVNSEVSVQTTSCYQVTRVFRARAWRETALYALHCSSKSFILIHKLAYN